MTLLIAQHRGAKDCSYLAASAPFFVADHLADERRANAGGLSTLKVQLAIVVRTWGSNITIIQMALKSFPLTFVRACVGAAAHTHT